MSDEWVDFLELNWHPLQAWGRGERIRALNQPPSARMLIRANSSYASISCVPKLAEKSEEGTLREPATTIFYEIARRRSSHHCYAVDSPSSSDATPAPLTIFYGKFPLRATHAMNVGVLYCREMGIYTDDATPTQLENSIVF